METRVEPPIEPPIDVARRRRSKKRKGGPPPPLPVLGRPSPPRPAVAASLNSAGSAETVNASAATLALAEARRANANASTATLALTEARANANANREPRTGPPTVPAASAPAAPSKAPPKLPPATVQPTPLDNLPRLSAIPRLPAIPPTDSKVTASPVTAPQVFEKRHDAPQGEQEKGEKKHSPQSAEKLAQDSAEQRQAVVDLLALSSRGPAGGVSGLHDGGDEDGGSRRKSAKKRKVEPLPPVGGLPGVHPVGGGYGLHDYRHPVQPPPSGPYSAPMMHPPPVHHCVPPVPHSRPMDYGPLPAHSRTLDYPPPPPHHDYGVPPPASAAPPPPRPPAPKPQPFAFSQTLRENLRGSDALFGKNKREKKKAQSSPETRRSVVDHLMKCVMNECEEHGNVNKLAIREEMRAKEIHAVNLTSKDKKRMASRREAEVTRVKRRSQEEAVKASLKLLLEIIVDSNMEK